MIGKHNSPFSHDSTAPLETSFRFLFRAIQITYLKQLLLNYIFFHTTRNWSVRPISLAGRITGNVFFSYTPGMELCTLNLFLCSPWVYLTWTGKQSTDRRQKNTFSCLSTTPRYHDQTIAIYKKIFKYYDILILYTLYLQYELYYCIYYIS